MILLMFLRSGRLPYLVKLPIIVPLTIMLVMVLPYVLLSSGCPTRCLKKTEDIRPEVRTPYDIMGLRLQTNKSLKMNGIERRLMFIRLLNRRKDRNISLVRVEILVT